MGDFYKVLDISRSATLVEIKAAYRKLALKYHPDTANGANKALAVERFQIISNAYNVLKDAAAREMYDLSWKKNSKNRVYKNVEQVYYGKSYVFRREVLKHEYDVAAWNAWHYGENAIKSPSVKQPKNKWMDLNNKHQRYFMRKNMRKKVDIDSDEADNLSSEEKYSKINADISAAASESLRNKRSERMARSSSSESYACCVS